MDQFNGTASRPPTVAKAPSAPPVAAQQVPLGILQTASPPASGDLQATLDYADLRMALQSGNFSGAQQAYLRLQGDMAMPQAMASLATVSGANGGYLNVMV